jgi:hypothetical protein
MRWPVTVATLTDAMVPDKLEWLGRALPDEQAQQVHDYVDGLTAEQRRGLAGPRDRLAILAELVDLVCGAPVARITRIR